MAVGPEYLKVRKIAQEVNDSLGSDHPCGRGNGECCKQRDVAVTIGDVLVITHAYKDGHISEDTLSKAEVNGTDESRDYCPFFDDQQRVCTIYDQRPLVCLTYGAGGLPQNPMLLMAAQIELSAGRDKQLPITDLRENKLCNACGECMLTQGKQIPISQIVKAAVVDQYINAQRDIVQKVPIDDFASYILPQLLENDKNDNGR